MKKAAVWAVAIDDLWSLGKPLGQGGPWKNTDVKAGEISDPYLIGFYDRKVLSLSHTAHKDVIFTIEVDPTGNGKWVEYAKTTVKPGETYMHKFDKAFQARWIRFVTDADASVTAWLDYK